MNTVERFWEDCCRQHTETIRKHDELPASHAETVKQHDDLLRSHGAFIPRHEAMLQRHVDCAGALLVRLSGTAVDHEQRLEPLEGGQQ